MLSIRVRSSLRHVVDASEEKLTRFRSEAIRHLQGDHGRVVSVKLDFPISCKGAQADIEESMLLTETSFDPRKTCDSIFYLVLMAFFG